MPASDFLLHGSPPPSFENLPPCLYLSWTHLEAPQSFIRNVLSTGTLVFTILLFLFPTVLLYYIVFTALRLLTLGQYYSLCIYVSPMIFVWIDSCSSLAQCSVLQLVLSAFVNVINHTPFYGIFLRLISSPYTTSGVSPLWLSNEQK